MQNNESTDASSMRHAVEEKIINVVFDEEMPTPDFKKIYTVPVKMDKQLIALVERIESLTEKMGDTNIESIEKITNVLSDLRNILTSIPVGNKEILDRISVVETKINGLQFESGVDYTKLERLENRFQDLNEKLDIFLSDERFVAVQGHEQILGKLKDIEDKMSAFQEFEERMLEMEVDEQRIINIENKTDELILISNDISKLLEGMSLEQIREKLDLLAELDKRARNLEEIVTELAEVSGKETVRFDRLDNFIDKTTIESENLREAIDEMRKFIDEFRKKATKKDSIIRKNLESLNENVNVLIDRVILGALEEGDKKMLELESITGISSDILLKRLKALAEIRVRLRGEGTDLLCSLIR